MIYTAQTVGALISSNNIEPAIRFCGLNGVINIGFLITIASNFSLWVFVMILQNSSVFATSVFFARLVSGVGCGLINSACLISRVGGKN